MEDVEWVVDDPVVGDVSLAGEAEAREFAAAVGGRAFKVTWRDGAPVLREEI